MNLVKRLNSIKDEPYGLFLFNCPTSFYNRRKKFNPLTGTVFSDKKIPITEWISYLLSLFEFHSIRSASRDNRNAGSTGKYWLKKVFAVLEDCQKDVMLSGNVYVDEIFFSVVTRKIVEKNGKKLRGISRNKICVMVGIDNSGHIVINAEQTSKPSNKSTWAALGAHIKPNSHLIHDGEHSHSILVNRLNLTEEVHPVEETKGLEDKDNPLDPINNLHSFIKRFMKEHGGFNRSELQDWMNLIWFILSEPDNRYDKVKVFIEKALLSPRKVKYRDTMSKKASVYRG